MRQYELKECVDVIVPFKESFYSGSYDLKEGDKTGNIRRVNINGTLSSGEIQTTDSVITSGTFDLKTRGERLLSANVKDVTIYDEHLNILRSTPTDSFNTFISQNESLIFVSDGDGYLTVYNEELERKVKLKVSKDTLWIVEVHQNIIYCGGEDGVLYLVDLDYISLRKSINIGCGITSLFFEDDFFLLGSYDENVYKISYDLKVKETTKIGGGIWRIMKKEENYVLSCMYEGVKVVNRKLELLESFEKGPLIYSLALIDDLIIFNSFYDKKLYVV